MKHHASGFAIGLMLLLASSVTAQQKAQRNPSQLLPENFPEVFEKIVQASKTGFATIKGAPMLGEEHAQATTKVYDFKWKTVVLPGATNCTIVQSQISDAQGKGKVTLSLGYQCQMNVDADQLIKGVRAGLGPGWSSAPCGSPEELSKRPEWKNDSCFCLDNDPDPKARLSQSGGLGCLRRVFIEHTERGLELAVASYNYDGLPQGAETEDDVSAA